MVSLYHNFVFAHQIMNFCLDVFTMQKIALVVNFLSIFLQYVIVFEVEFLNK